MLSKSGAHYNDESRILTKKGIHMRKTDTLDTLIDRILAGLPSGLEHLGRDAEHNLRAALQSALRKMDLVTREEFDIQREVLARTRARLESLEKQVKDLEERDKIQE